MEIKELTEEEKKIIELGSKLFTYDEYEENFIVNDNDEIIGVEHIETTRTGEPISKFTVTGIRSEDKSSEFTVEIVDYKTNEKYSVGGFNTFRDVGSFITQANMEFCEKHYSYIGNKRIDLILDEMDFDDLYNKFVDCFKLNCLTMQIIEKFVLDTDYNDDFREFIIENFKGEFSTEQLYDIFHKQVIEMNLK